MARRKVEHKEDISPWYVKRIPDFKNLTENEALFEYEAIKLRERARKYAKRNEIVYHAPKIVRPTTVIETDVSALRRVEHEEIKEAVRYNEPIIKYSNPIYDYEYTWWKEEKLPDYREPDYAANYEPYDYYEYESEDDSTDYDSEDNYLSEAEEEMITKQLNQEYGTHDIDDYWVDPTTGEAILWEQIKYADAERSAKEFLEDLKVYLQEEADKAAIAHSYYANGRTKSASQRKFYDNNINSALQTILDKIDAILNNPDKLDRFVNSHRGATNAWEQLVLAASEYIHDSYKSKGGDPVQAARLNALLDAGPISLSEAMDFVDEAYDIDE